MMHVKLLEGVSEVEEAIQELVRTRPSTKWEIMRALAGRFTRLELHLAFIALCRKRLILRHATGWYQPRRNGESLALQTVASTGDGV
jgi:hypothetical protein